MARFIARAVVTLALLYAGAATVFAFTYYDGARPDVPTVLTDFNAWALSFFDSPKKPASPPPAPPAPRRTEDPAPPPSDPPVYVPADPETRELQRIQDEVLPKVEELGRKLRDMDRGNGVEFDRLRTEAMSLLSKERAYLDGILEKNPEHKQANRLWSRLQEMFVALKKL